MGLVFHIRCITPRFAFSLMPPFPGDFRLPSCDLLLNAASNVCSHRNHLRITKHKPARSPKPGFHSFLCMSGLGLSFSSVASPTLKYYLQSFFFFVVFQVSFFDYQRNIQFLFHTCLCFHSLLPARQISEGSPPFLLMRTT